MSRPELERLLSQSPAVASHLRGIYDSANDIQSFAFLIDLNEANVMIFHSSDNARKRWLALVIDTEHSYYIDCLHQEPEASVHQVLNAFASNGYSRLPTAPCIAASSPRLTELSAQICIYYVERVCAKTRTRPLNFTHNFEANARLVHAWFKDYKSRRRLL